MTSIANIYDLVIADLDEHAVVRMPFSAHG